MQTRHRFALALAVALSGAAMLGAQAMQTYKGLEVHVAGIERATIVSLSDCPPGANTQRGVIKPGEATEFAAVKVDFKVTPAFKPGALAKAGPDRCDGQDLQHRPVVRRDRQHAVLHLHVRVPRAEGHQGDEVRPRHRLDRRHVDGAVRGAGNEERRTKNEERERRTQNAEQERGHVRRQPDR